VGLLFLPYTGMVLSFAVMGSLLAGRISYERVLAIVVIYFFGLGIAAHALDALGSKGMKPWGTVFTKVQLWMIAGLALAVAYGVAAYYMVRYAPALWAVAIVEGFFVFAYNLEWFAGRFHTDAWFAVSWGALPVLAGYVMQTNTMSLAALVVALSMGLFALLEIKTSRPYKELKRRGLALGVDERALLQRYEALLKCVSLGVIFLCAGLLLARIGG
jgi:voltage-gated potassium channel Kch